MVIGGDRVVFGWCSGGDRVVIGDDQQVVIGW